MICCGIVDVNDDHFNWSVQPDGAFLQYTERMSLQSESGILQQSIWSSYSRPVLAKGCIMLRPIRKSAAHAGCRPVARSVCGISTAGTYWPIRQPWQSRKDRHLQLMPLLRWRNSSMGLEACQHLHASVHQYSPSSKGDHLFDGHRQYTVLQYTLARVCTTALAPIKLNSPASNPCSCSDKEPWHSFLHKICGPVVCNIHWNASPSVPRLSDMVCAFLGCMCDQIITTLHDKQT